MNDDLKTGITLLTGPNGFLLSKQKKDLISRFAKEHGEDSVVSFDGSQCEWSDVHQALEGVSLFASSDKIIVLNDPGSNKALCDEIVAWIEQKSSSYELSVLLLLVQPKIDKRSVFYKVIKASGSVQEFKEMDEFELAKWVRNVVAQKNGKIGSSEARMIVDFVGPDQLQLENEIDKLVNYSNEVSKQSIEEMVEPRLQETIFQLLDAIAGRNQDEASAIYHSLVANRVQPFYIMTMISWQLHNVLIVKLAGNRTDNEISKDHKISSYVVSKTRNFAGKLSLNDIKAMLEESAKTDILLKSSRADSNQLVEALIARLSLG